MAVLVQQAAHGHRRTGRSDRAAVRLRHGRLRGRAGAGDRPALPARPASRAFEVVAGFTILNDVSARDWQWRTPTFTMGKSFDTHAPCGPELVTGDELGDPGSLGIRTWVNDELRQDSTTADMIFGCAEMIEYLTTAFPLEPGTVIATGTPAGVGAGFDPPRSWLPATPSASPSKGSARCPTPSSRAAHRSPSASPEAASRGLPGSQDCAARSRSARLAMTCSAKVRRLAHEEEEPPLVDDGQLVSSTATAVALRARSTRAISPKVSSGPISKAAAVRGGARPCPRSRRTSPAR